MPALPTGPVASAATPRPLSRPLAIGLVAIFALAALAIYSPALHGAFLSDDENYVSQNPYIQNPNVDNLIAILDPGSPVPVFVNNYAPAHLLLYVAQWSVFGSETTGYHVVNVLFHALATFALVVLFLRAGIGLVPAALGGAIFLVHPANVEAVAWIAQLKSPVALLLSVGALLALRRRPILAAVLFALALLVKPNALFAVPVAAVLTWLDRSATRRDWAWVGVWALMLAAYLVLEYIVYDTARSDLPPLYADPLVRIFSSGAIGLRYVAMALTGYGLSTFHEPLPVESAFDPWWLGSLAILALLVWRIVVAFRRRRVEAAFWTWAAASFAPVSGILSLPFPMADRYLYFILPGLIGALLLWGAELRGRAAGRAPGAAWTRAAAPAALLVGAVLLVGFAVQTYARAGVWVDGYQMMADAERHYPEGMAAKTRQATRAAREGRVEDAVAALRAAHARGYRRLDQILQEPAYQPYLKDPRFRPVVLEIAAHLLEIHADDPDPSQGDLRTMALAYHVRGETDTAIALLERALDAGDVYDDAIRADLANLRLEQRLREYRKRHSNEASGR